MSEPTPRVTPPSSPAPRAPSRRVVAYQLSLLGDAPRVGYAWRPTFYTWSFCGLTLPLPDDAERQLKMLRPDSWPPRAPLEGE